jgi:nucleolysin TIA-1/TIAR
MAEAALNALNGRKIFDTEIKVNWAHQSNTNAVQKEDLSSHFHVFVGDLSPELNDETLKKAFAAFGSLSDARVMWDLATGKSRGYGFLAYRERADAEQAINAMNGEWLGSRAIRVNWANQRTGGEGGAPGPGPGPGAPGAGGPVRISNLPPFLGPPAEGGAAGAPPAAGEAAASSTATQPGDVPGTGLGPDGQPAAVTTQQDQPENPYLAPQQQQQQQQQPPQQGQGQRPPPQAPRFQPAKPLTYDVVVQQAPPSNSTVYVGNLAPEVQQGDLIPLFARFGYIAEVRVHASTEKASAFAFVKLDTHQSAAQAIVNVNGAPVHNRPVKCAWGKEKLGSASDTSVIAGQQQANGAGVNVAGLYAGFMYGAFPNGGKSDAPKKELSPAQSSYYAQYYDYQIPGAKTNGV